MSTLSRMHSLIYLLTSVNIFQKHLSSGYGKHPIGKNYLASSDKLLAAKLRLEEAEGCTGHCIRRTLATDAAHGRATTMGLKRYIEWYQQSTGRRRAVTRASQENGKITHTRWQQDIDGQIYRKPENQNDG